MTHICVNDLTSIGSDNGLLPGRRQAIIWTNDGILLIRPLGTNFSGISSKILTFSFKKMRLKLSSAKWRPFCLGLNVLMNLYKINHAIMRNESLSLSGQSQKKSVMDNLSLLWVFTEIAFVPTRLGCIIFRNSLSLCCSVIGLAELISWEPSGIDLLDLRSVAVLGCRLEGFQAASWPASIGHVSHPGGHSWDYCFGALSLSLQLIWRWGR